MNSVQTNEPLLGQGETKSPSCFQRWSACLVTVLAATTIGLFIGVIVLASKNSSSDSNGVSLISSNLTSQILSMRDTSLDPCDDFYQYACNGWFKANPNLLGNASSYYYSFNSIGDKVAAQQLDILKGHFPFLTSFYEECKDLPSIDSQGLVDIQNIFNSVDLASLSQLFQLLGTFQANGLANSAFFNLAVQPDNAFADVYRAYLQPNGLSAPSPFFYNDPSFAPYFTSIVKQTFSAAGLSDTLASQAAQDVLSTEQFIANLTVLLPNFQDQGVLINNTVRISIAQLNTWCGFQTNTLNGYFQSLSSTPVPLGDIDVVAPFYFSSLGKYLNNGRLSAFKNYVKWHVLFGNMAYLPASFRVLASNLTNAGFPAYRLSVTSPLKGSPLLDVFGQNTKNNMNGNIVFGKPSPHARLLKDDAAARDSFCVQSTIAQFSDLVSHEWVLKDFSDAQKAQATSLVDAIYAKIGERIKAVDWLDEQTRANALVKWANIIKNVGYSNDWLDYSKLSFKGTLFADLQAISLFMTAANNGLYLQPVDRSLMPTRDYMIQNAFYNPSTNNINLLGGLIFPPFFDTSAPMMLNFAAYGMVIGHEITHGFDNSGRLFNGTGAYINWWTDKSAAEFNSRAQCLIDQYSSFVVDGQHVNGAQTLGENIADHGGINTAFSAYKAFAQPPNGAQLINGITNDQLFFLYYAQNWCAETTVAFALNRLVTDVHSPARWRVNGPLSNKKEFAQAYSCSPTSFMGRSLTDKQCVLW